MKSTRAWPIEKLLSTVGRTVRLKFSNGLAFDAMVLDGKVSWGKARIQVAPVAGTGTDWVEASRILKVTPPLYEPVAIPAAVVDLREKSEAKAPPSGWMK